MSAERDELAKIIAGMRFKAGTRRPQTELEQADAILAAGYRKIFDGDCGLSNAAPDERDAAEAWMRWANILNTSPDEERNGIAAMQQMLTELGYRKPEKVKGNTPLGKIRELLKHLDSWESQEHSTVGIGYLRRHFKDTK